MMHFFVRLQGTTKYPFCHQTMLSDITNVSRIARLRFGIECPDVTRGVKEPALRWLVSIPPPPLLTDLFPRTGARAKAHIATLDGITFG
jgi:hypothetical protein